MGGLVAHLERIRVAAREGRRAAEARDQILTTIPMSAAAVPAAHCNLPMARPAARGPSLLEEI